MRETAFSAKDHAVQVPSGAAILVDPRDMDDLIDRLQNGDPTKGWEGDPRLCIAFNRVTQRFELWRREADEEYRLVCQSRPGMSFPHNLIDEIVAHDVRRGYNPHDTIAAHNAKIDAEKDDRAHEAQMEALLRVRKGMINDGLV